MVNGIVSLIFLSDFSLLVYRNVRGFPASGAAPWTPTLLPVGQASPGTPLAQGSGARPPHLQLAREEALELLLQAEGEGQPTHVGGLTALPEVHDALEVLLRLLLLRLGLFSTFKDTCDYNGPN